LRKELSLHRHRLVTILLPLAGLAVAASTAAAPAMPAWSCRAGAVQRIGGERRAVVAVAGAPLAARESPGGPVAARFGIVNQNDFPTVFWVRARKVDASCRAAWYLVQVPLRPNGRTAWVAAWRVKLASVATRIDVDLSERRLRLYVSGRLRLTTRAGIGAPGTPTPVGRFYVNQILIPPVAGGPFGPAAFGVSAFSPTLRNWPQDGPIAIHGTNEPDSIGAAVSHGCIRISDAAARALHRLVLAGTPVVIHR
jgi:lipoprotein-anchoring transpeptidase ErfK/SrfK